jgi:hypothetical protein
MVSANIATTAPSTLSTGASEREKAIMGGG